MLRIPAVFHQLKFPEFDFKKVLGLLCNIQECSRACCIMLSRVIPYWFMNIRILCNHTEYSRLPGLLI